MRSRLPGTTFFGWGGRQGVGMGIIAGYREEGRNALIIIIRGIRRGEGSKEKKWTSSPQPNSR